MNRLPNGLTKMNNGTVGGQSRVATPQRSRPLIMASLSSVPEIAPPCDPGPPFAETFFSGGDGLLIDVPPGTGLVVGYVVMPNVSGLPGNGAPKGNWGDTDDPDFPRWYGQVSQDEWGEYPGDAWSFIYGGDGTTTDYGALFYYDRSDPLLALEITNGYDLPMEGRAFDLPMSDSEARWFFSGGLDAADYPVEHSNSAIFTYSESTVSDPEVVWSPDPSSTVTYEYTASTSYLDNPPNKIHFSVHDFRCGGGLSLFTILPDGTDSSACVIVREIP
jgi:hypothetical protein